MADSTPATILRELLREAASAEAPGPHPADDLEQLTVWAAGQLPDSESDRLIDHLSRCGRCRLIVIELVRTGVLEIRPFSEPTPEPRRRRRKWVARAGGFVLAASILLVVGWLVFRPGPASELDRSRQEFAAGEYEAARDRLTQWLPSATGPAERAAALELLEASGYAAARRELRSRRIRVC